MPRAVTPHDLAFPAAAVGLAAMVSLAVSLAPANLLDSLIVASGLPALVGAAEPPLGAKARALLAFVSGSAAALALLGAYLAIEYRGRAARRRPAVAAHYAPPVLRKGDAHPDAPARRPIFAAVDLGAVEEAAIEAPKVERPRDTVPDLLARFERGLVKRRMGGAGWVID